MDKKPQALSSHVVLLSELKTFFFLKFSSIIIALHSRQNFSATTRKLCHPPPHTYHTRDMVVKALNYPKENLSLALTASNKEEN